MADNNQTSSGFNLPNPNAPSAQSGLAATGAPGAPGNTTINLGLPAVSQGTSSRDLMIGGTILLVLVIAFFFAKNAYATSLVAKKVQPRSANAAGWWLFIFLTLLSVGVVMAVISNSVLMTPFIIGPLSIGAIVALVLMIVSGRR